MTVSELYESVARLGFETGLEDSSSFFYASNRAILEVNRIRPATSTYVIHHRPLRNALASDFSVIEKTDELVFESENVRAYYFECDGNGIVYVESYDESAEKWILISAISLIAERTSVRSFAPYRGLIRKDGAFVTGRIRLRFSGEYLYSVRNVALYRELYSDRTEDIPAYERYTRYDLSALCPDFLSLSAPPRTEDDHYMLPGCWYDVENNRVILLPHDGKGVYKILYHRMPTPLVYTDDPLEDQTAIDLDEELCALLPLLVAGYLWMDDEPEKAQYYMSLYRDRAMMLEMRHCESAPATIRSVNDW